MGNLGITEILLIGVVLLLLFGPSQLPKLGRSLGEGIREFKKAGKEITEAIKEDATDNKK
jgi:sec-independent protein translocase protein TatA